MNPRVGVLGFGDFFFIFAASFSVMKNILEKCERLSNTLSNTFSTPNVKISEEYTFQTYFVSHVFSQANIKKAKQGPNSP